MQHMQRTTAPRVMFDTRRCSLDFTDGPMRDCEGRASTFASLQLLASAVSQALP